MTRPLGWFFSSVIKGIISARKPEICCSVRCRSWLVWESLANDWAVTSSALRVPDNCTYNSVIRSSPIRVSPVLASSWKLTRVVAPSSNTSSSLLTTRIQEAGD